MSTELAQVTELTPEQAGKLEKIQGAWVNLADVVYRRKLSLELQVQNQQAKKIPVTIETLVKAESILKDMKSARTSIVAQRLEVTNRIGQISDNLMLPEKELDKLITEYSQEIIAAKREHEKADQAKRDKVDEIRRLKENITKYVADHDYKCRTSINDKAAIAFNHALNTDVKPEEIAAYIEKVKVKLGVADFDSSTPNINVKLLDVTEVNLIMDECFRNNPHAYNAIWHEKLATTFATYEVAYANKKEALELAEVAAAEEKAKLVLETANKKIGAEIEASAQSLEVSAGPVVKALKKVYELDMPETSEAALQIWRAYAGNKTLVDSKLRISKWLSATPAQIGAALAKCKSDDNSFEVQGVHFKATDKL
jgi:hypothetical protein